MIHQISQSQSIENLPARCAEAETSPQVSLMPFQHPYLAVTTAIQTQAALQSEQIPLERKVAAKHLLYMFAAYCARICPESQFDLGLKMELVDRCGDIAQQTSIRIQVDQEESFQQFQERLEASLDLAERQIDIKDLLWPSELELPSAQMLPVTVAIAASPDRLDWQGLNTAMALVAYEDGSMPELVHAGALNSCDSAAIVRQLQCLIGACLDRPEQNLARLPLLSIAEQQQLVVEWNQTKTPIPDLSIHQLFEQQVARTPDSVALICESQQLTYNELNQRANQLAHYLRLQGVGADFVVGIQMERSIAMVVSLLAIHKAGGAYLPLDPDFPLDRLNWMLTDSQAQIVLTQQQLLTHLPTDEDRVRAIPIDLLWDEISQQPTTNPDYEVHPANLSYIIYTSGSTGKPKGVMVEHRNVVNFCVGMDARIACEPAGVWLAVTSLSFDISVMELFWTLTRGFKTIVYHPKTARSQSTTLDNSIAALIDRHRVTHLQCTPSMASMLIADPTTRQALGQIHTMMVGGEALTEALAIQLQQIIPGQVHNMYGPTETTIWSTTHLMQEIDGVVPLGRPIANTELYILDRHQQPVPVGIAGELFIGGKGVTRGYLNRPDLTSQRFVPNPFHADPTSRLYRTGDLVRYHSNGNLEFLGRIDFQVKVRGYRIELGEIETILSRHETLAAVAIVVREDLPGDKRLVAYCIPQREQQPNHATLRAYLRSQLPEYMVPSNFVMLDKFPLTPNNKVDRQAFPAPLLVQQSEATDRSIDPSQTIEQTLIEIWQEVLQNSNISIADSFFDLGGNSLMAVRLFAKIEQIWNKHLGLSILLESPTIAALANVIRQEQAQDCQTWSPLVLLKSGGNLPPLFCIHPIGGNVFDYYHLSKILDIDRPIYGLQARGIDGEQPPFDRIEDMANYFIEAISSVQPDGAYYLLGYSFGGIVAFEIARQLATCVGVASRNENRQVAFLGLLDIRNPWIAQIERISLKEWLNIQFTNIQKLTLKQKVKYIIDKLFAQRSLESRYRDEVIAQLSDFPDFKPELIGVLNCNLTAMENYRPQIFAGTAHLFWSEFQNSYIDRYPDLGWGDFVTGGLAIDRIPGNHNTLMKEPNIRVLAEHLKSSIESHLGSDNRSS